MRISVVKYALVFASLLFLSAAAWAATWYVDDDNAPGPGSGTQEDPFSKIQYGIDAASDGDAVLVMPGLYVENLDFLGKGITVVSSQGPGVTVVDGNRSGSVVVFQNNEGTDSILEGFTLTNGSGTLDNSSTKGGAILCSYASPSIKNNILSHNEAYIGGGLYGSEANPIITNNFVFGNSAFYGGAFCFVGSSPIITNNTLSRNTADFRGGAVYVYHVILTITNSILWNNSAWDGKEIGGYSSSLLITYSAVQGGFQKEGNIGDDPLFLDPEEWDFHLSPASPCVDAGSGSAAELPSSDFDGDSRTENGIPDMGADEVVQLYVPAQHGAIQAGIAAAVDGNIVLVWPGAYVETLDFLGKAIMVESKEGPALTIIDGNQEGSVVTFQSGEGSSSILEGFTITNGAGGGSYPDFTGGGIACIGSSPTIQYNRIVGNSAIRGGGISCTSFSVPLIKGNVISENTAGLGGGIACDLAKPVILNNTIFRNSATTLGGGIFSNSYSYPAITNNTITENEAAQGGGILFCDANSTTTVTNTILWGNTAISDPELGVYSGYPPTITYCDIAGGWEGECNISADPLFVDPTNGDFRLRLQSSCVDRGTNFAPSLPEKDFEGDVRIVDGNLDIFAVVDMGADELLPEIAARFGTVNGAGSALANVLFINSSPGNNKRVYSIPAGNRVTLIMNAPPAGPNPAGFVLYMIAWEPGLADMAKQPYRIGTACMPMPLSNGTIAPPPYTIANTIKYFRLLGNPLLINVPSAPCTVFSVLSIPRGVYTFQGTIFDNGSAGYGASLTNGIVLKVF